MLRQLSAKQVLQDYVRSNSLCMQMLRQLRAQQLICGLLQLLDYACSDSLCMQMLRQLHGDFWRAAGCCLIMPALTAYVFRCCGSCVQSSWSAGCCSCWIMPALTANVCRCCGNWAQSSCCKIMFALTANVCRCCGNWAQSSWSAGCCSCWIMPALTAYVCRCCGSCMATFGEQLAAV